MENKFNFESAVCTSREQSERLLALGLKKETADCYFFYCDIAKEWKRTILSSTQVFKDYPTTVIPAWSLHRLMRLVFNSGGTHVELFEDDDAYEILMYQIEMRIEEGYFNKEYLV